MLLKDLCNASGVSGHEEGVRSVIAASLPDLEMHVDAMGNLLCEKRGNGPKIMFAAHMDEVGLLISDVDENGFLQFKIVGGINTDVLLGKKVYIGDKKIPGIVGVCAVHLQKKDARKAAVKPEDMYIDIGTTCREESLDVISIGDYAVFPPSFTYFGDNLVDAKAIDDRSGCALLIRLLHESYDAHICCAFTAQEEVGTRGAQAAASYFNPEYAVIVETTFCADIFPTEPKDFVTTLGGGVALPFMDRTATPDSDLVSSIMHTADKNNIPYQRKRSGRGGTDAGVISRAATGIPTAILALPCRNLHSPSSVMCMDDYENAWKLLDTWLRSAAPSLKRR